MSGLDEKNSHLAEYDASASEAGAASQQDWTPEEERRAKRK
jgi:hypothetical protein